MRVILMSGYPDGALLVLNYGWYFIQKPFVAVQLVAKINEVLYGEVHDQGTDHFDVFVTGAMLGKADDDTARTAWPTAENKE